MCLGIPGQVIAIADPETQLGVVDVGGVRRSTSLVMVRREGEPIESLVGSWVLIHVGFAMSRIDELEARRTLALLQEMGEAMALEGGERP
ncbi:MAG: HypC/HybG/HupF family hydrogenase formation chaperone [Deltaproteobacteria bacterium]|nr:HypC/HybG/HupF family hydrogenase formation chaperone [Deltaproteobacteria bacterium]